MRRKLNKLILSVVVVLCLFIATFAKFFFETVASISIAADTETKNSSDKASTVRNGSISADNIQERNAVESSQSDVKREVAAQRLSADVNTSETEKYIGHFIGFLKFGPSKVSQIDYDRARREIAINPKPAVNHLVSLIENSAASDVEMRQGAFAALAQVIEDVKLNNPSALDEILEMQIETVRSEVAKQELILNDSFNSLTSSQKEELTHLRPFKLVNGKLYSMSLPAQLGALFSLGIAGTPVATSELNRIAASTAYSENVRGHARRMLDSNLFQ